MSEKVSGIGIECSNVCNMAHTCTHCYGVTGKYDPRNRIELSEDMIQILLEEAPMMVETVTITGGEPTSYPDLVERLVSGLDLPWTMMTNGSVFEPRLAPETVLVSLDPQDLRPKLDPEKVMENSLKYKANLSVNTVLSAGVDLFWFYDLMKRAQKEVERNGKKIHEWKFGFVIPEGKAAEHPHIFPDQEKLFRHLREFLKVYFKEMPFDLAIRGIFFSKNVSSEEDGYMLDFNSNPCLDCFHRDKYLSVNTERELQLCGSCRSRGVPITDSLIDSGLTLMDRPELNNYTYHDWKDCHECKWFNICAAGCPALAEIYGQGWFGRDLLQCSLMEYTEKYLLDIFPSYLQKMFQN